MLTIDHSESAVRHLTEAPESVSSRHGAIRTYQTLQDFVASVASQCESAEAPESQQLHLISFLESLRDKTWNDLKATLTT
jgi:RAD50-interacting protein 1